jgi:hypothetical protein
MHLVSARLPIGQHVARYIVVYDGWGVCLDLTMSALVALGLADRAFGRNGHPLQIGSLVDRHFAEKPVPCRTRRQYRLSRIGFHAALRF